MKRITIAFLGVLAATGFCIGQESTSAVGHGSFPVKVTKTLDSSKLKDGDTVELETAGSFKLADGTLVPKGSKMFGHVATAKARSKGDSQSQLTLAFDKLSVTGGSQLALKGSVQAVFPPQEEVDPGIPGSSAHQGGGGGAAPGYFPAPDYKPEAKTGSNTDSGSHGNPVFAPNAVGVHGFDNLDLEDGILSSKGKNVKLGSGVRLIVHADILG